VLIEASLAISPSVTYFIEVGIMILDYRAYSITLSDFIGIRCYITPKGVRMQYL
jgi:hypothetical protein